MADMKKKNMKRENCATLPINKWTPIHELCWAFQPILHKRSPCSFHAHLQKRLFIDFDPQLGVSDHRALHVLFLTKVCHHFPKLCLLNGQDKPGRKTKMKAQRKGNNGECGMEVLWSEMNSQNQISKIIHPKDCFFFQADMTLCLQKVVV